MEQACGTTSQRIAMVPEACTRHSQSRRAAYALTFLWPQWHEELLFQESNPMDVWPDQGSQCAVRLPPLLAPARKTGACLVPELVHHL